MTEAIDQAFSGNRNIGEIIGSAVLGGITSGLAHKLIPLKGFQPYLTKWRGWSDFGRNSLRMIGQEIFSSFGNDLLDKLFGGNNQPCDSQYPWVDYGYPVMYA